jgi:aldehyde dehydrogenase (NAD+)
VLAQHDGTRSTSRRPSGPVVSEVQRDRIRRYIRTGIDEGMRLVASGPEAPEHLERGYFVRPTVFSGGNHHTLARQGSSDRSTS